MSLEQESTLAADRVPFWLAPRVVRRSPAIVSAWFEHENQFCRGSLAISYLLVAFIMICFIPLDINFGTQNPSLLYSLKLRGFPALLLILCFFYLRMDRRPLGEKTFFLHKCMSILVLSLAIVLQHAYTADFPDRARFYPPIMAAFAIFIIRLGPSGSAVVFLIEVISWLSFAELNGQELFKDLNYQLFGLMLGILFQRRIAHEAKSFVSEEKRKAVEREIEVLRNKRTRTLLQRFLPSDVAENIIVGRVDLDATPQMRCITVLFCDIAGFSQLSQRVPIRDVGVFLNHYFTTMTDIIFEHGGMIDKFIGDGIMAIFGFPSELSPQEQAVRATTCAQAMIRSLPQLQSALSVLLGDEAVRIRIGLNQGDAIVGGFGGERRTDFTAIGPTVNMAQRIESAASPNSIYISEGLAEILGFANCRAVGERLLRGIGERPLYEVTVDSPKDPMADQAEAGRQRMAG